MAKKLHWLLVLSLAWVMVSCAKRYEANGYVYSIITKQPIDSATVTVYLGDTTQVYDVLYTDPSGYFSIQIGDLGCGTDCPEFSFELGAPGHKSKKYTKMEGDRIYLDAL